MASFFLNKTVSLDGASQNKLHVSKNPKTVPRAKVYGNSFKCGIISSSRGYLGEINLLSTYSI